MRISFQAAQTEQNTEHYKVENREAMVQKASVQSGYALDITGKAKDNDIYSGQGRTTEDIMQEAGMQDVALTRDYMAVMSNSMSDEEFAKLQEDGFHPGSMEIENAVTIIDQIKASLAQAGVTVTGFTDTLDMATLTEITGNEGLARDMAHTFSEAGVPLTEETAKAAMQTLKEAETLQQPTEDTLKYMITNGKEAVVEDLYMSQYSSRLDSGRGGRGYYQDANGYLSKKADSKDLESLRPQILAVLEEAGMADMQGAEDAAKWIIQSDIPLTKESLHAYMTLQKIHLPMDRNALLNSMATAVADGKNTGRASLVGEKSTWQQAKEIWQQVRELSYKAADMVAEQGKALTIQNLQKAQELLNQNGQTEVTDTTADGMPTVSDVGNITARRQLEEVRLQMTIAANRALLKSGYSIETASLEELVLRLRKMEEEQKQILFSGENKQETEIRGELYKETLGIISEVPALPLAVVGKAAFINLSLGQVKKEGEALTAAYQKAGQQYETFRTRPDRELGDSIRTAFRNADALLEELELEPTTANRRAIRILGYNSMEITEENIQTVKTADQTLNGIIRKMTPAAVLKMIRDGKNPLELTVEQLDDYLSGEQQKEEAEQEKFSKFLYKLEQKNEITETEKESYIGIFRLLRQIEKTDGAVIGSLLHQGAEINFKNLLSAVRTYRAKPIDTLVDDETGITQDVKRAEATIDAQINRAFTKLTAEEVFYQKIANEAYELLDGHRITVAAPTEETGLEEFAMQLRQIEPEEEGEQAYRRQQLSAIRETAKAEAEDISFLEMLEEPVTLDNLAAATEYRKDLRKTFMKIKEEADNYIDSASKGFEEAASELEENFDSRENASKSYQKLVKTEKQILEDAIFEKEEITSLHVKELGLMYKQISFTAKLADTQQYEIPIITRDSVLALHLQIQHSSENKGMIEASMETQTYGKLLVRLKIQKNEIRGIYAAAQREDVQAMSELKEQIEAGLLDSGFQKQNTNTETDAGNDEMTTAELYKAAKVVIRIMHNQAERG